MNDIGATAVPGIEAIFTAPEIEAVIAMLAVCQMLPADIVTIDCV